MPINKALMSKATDQHRADQYALSLSHALRKTEEKDGLYTVKLGDRRVTKDATIFDCAKFGHGFTFHPQT